MSWRGRVLKPLVFYTVTLTPLLVLVGIVLYLLFLTNLPQRLYTDSIRNIFFDCVQFVPEDYVYKMKPGGCRVKNIEYDVVLTHDADGFRNGAVAPPYEVAVLGDSFAHGIGVGDDQTFSHLLSSRYHYRVRNLAIGSYATMRELDVLKQYGGDAKYVVLQYCSNDGAENELSVTLPQDAFRAQVETRWKTLIVTYNKGKASGYRKPMTDLLTMIRTGAYSSKAAWRQSFEVRDTSLEASYVAQIFARYQDVLKGRRLVILEASAWASNSAWFDAAFRPELARLGWLSYRVINTARILDRGDYFFLDDHVNSGGHRKLAAVIAEEIARWERADPVLRRP